MSLLARCAPFVLGLLVVLSPVCLSAPSVPGCVVHTFVSGIAKPYRLAFSPSGTLFVGNNTNVAPEWVKRVPIGGQSYSTYGTTSYDDPDAVAFDVTGSISGTPGSLLVGRAKVAGATAFLTAILPTQAVVDIEGPSDLLGNPDDLTFDHSGRLLIADFHAGHVLVKSGSGVSTVLFTIPSPPVAIAVDPSNRIFTSAQDGKIRLHAADGSLLNPAFLSGFPGAPIDVGPGGATWGTDLYCVNNNTGELLRIAPNGTPSVIGSGFGLVGDLAFGPDSLMYLSMYNDSLVLRIFPAALLGVPTLDNAAPALFSASPNPARGPVQFQFTSGPEASAGCISVISVDGRLVRSLRYGVNGSGQTRWMWDRRDEGGRIVPPGLYFVRLDTGRHHESLRITLVE